MTGVSGVFSPPAGAYEPGFEPDKKIVELPNPFVVGKDARVLCQTFEIQTPVVYCIDTGESMGDVYIYAREAVRASIRSLRADDKFGVVLIQDPQTILVGGRLYPGGPTTPYGQAVRRDAPGGYDKIRRLLVSEYDEGGPDDPKVQVAGAPDLIDGIKTALKQNPRTLVLLLSRNKIEHPQDLGKLVKEANARLVLIVLGIENDEQKKSFEKAVRAAGGNSKLLLYDAIRVLQDHYDQKDLNG